MDYKIAKLTDLSSPKQWKTLSTEQLLSNGFPVYGANGKIGFYSEYNHEEPTLMITCRGATCGSINLSEPKSWINGNAMCLDDLSEDLDVNYLRYYLLNYDFSNVVSGSAQPQITRENLKKVNVKYYEIETQKQIAATLDKVTRIITENKKLLEKYDLLIKSRFIEMFGDPVTNPIGWEMTELGNVCTEVKYGTSKPATENGKYTYLRMNNITYEGELDLTNIKTIDISDDELPKCSVRKGDILFNRTNSVDLCGKTCLFKLDETMVIAGYIIRVRVNEKLNPQYVATFFNTKSIKKMLREMAKGAVNQANINAQEMQAIKIPLPPIGLQNDYELFVQQIDKSKFVVQKSLEKAETLYKSLMQEYFG